MRRVLPVAVLAAVAAMAPASAQEADRDYYLNWLAAQQALQAFATVTLTRDGADDLSSYRDHASRHGVALAALAEALPPAEAAFHHWRLLPLHERAQAGMTLVVRGMEAGDPAATTAGWSQFAAALDALQRESRGSE